MIDRDLRPDQGHDYEDIVALFPQPFWELLLSFAVALIPISTEIWKHQRATLAVSGQAPT